MGAGISGLLIGYHFKKKGYEVQIYEASSRVGGLIETKKTPYGMAETAAHSLLVSPPVESFFKELGLELISVNPESKARFIVRNSKMRKIPLTLLEIISTLFHFFKRPKLQTSRDNLTLQEWGTAYLGSAATQFLLAPFVTGVYASSPAELNASLTFPALVPDPAKQSLFHWFRARKKSAPPSQGRPQMKTLRYGLQSLVDRLHEELKGQISLNTKIDDLATLEGNIILTVPTLPLSNLIQSTDPTSSEALQKVRYSPLITITAFFESTGFNKSPPKGVGVLIPRSEKYRILGCLFNSSAFSGRVLSENHVSLSLMVGGTSDPNALNLTDKEIKELLDQEVQALLGSTRPPLHLEITRWEKAIPIFSSELKTAQNSLKNGFCAKPGRVVFANFSQSVSIRSLIENLT